MRRMSGEKFREKRKLCCPGQKSEASLNVRSAEGRRETLVLTFRKTEEEGSGRNASRDSWLGEV